MSIRSYGFLSIEIDEDLSNICEVIPHAKEITRLGREQTIQGDTWRFLDRSLVGPGGIYVGWHMIGLYREGSYGKIYKAHRMVVRRRVDGLFDVDFGGFDINGEHVLVVLFAQQRGFFAETDVFDDFMKVFHDQAVLLARVSRASPVTTTLR
jgi:hypothetical protein